MLFQKDLNLLTGVDPPLDGAVVLLEHVVQIWHRPMPAILGESAFGFELRDGGRIRGVAVGVDHPRRGMVRSAKRFGEKAPSRRNGRPSSPESRASGVSTSNFVRLMNRFCDSLRLRKPRLGIYSPRSPGIFSN